MATQLIQEPFSKGGSLFKTKEQGIEIQGALVDIQAETGGNSQQESLALAKLETISFESINTIVRVQIRYAGRDIALIHQRQRRSNSFVHSRTQVPDEEGGIGRRGRTMGGRSGV